MTQEEISKLRISDVLEMPAFNKHLSNILYELRKFHTKHENELKRSVYDRLNEKNLLSVRSIKELYTEVLRKNLRTLSATERRFIAAIGDEAFNRTMQELLTPKNEDNEKDN